MPDRLSDSRKSSRPRRYFRYRVTGVGGSMEGRIAIGDLTFDYWHGRNHSYTIADLRTGDATGWYSVKSEGECSDEEYAKLAEATRRNPADAIHDELEREILDVLDSTIGRDGMDLDTLYLGYLDAWSRATVQATLQRLRKRGLVRCERRIWERTD